MKMKFDVLRMNSLVKGDKKFLAEACMEDFESEIGGPMPPGMKRVAVAAFMMGYNKALRNVLSIVEEEQSNANHS